MPLLLVRLSELKAIIVFYLVCKFFLEYNTVLLLQMQVQDSQPIWF